MSWLRRLVCRLFRLVLFEEHQRVMVSAAKSYALLRDADELHKQLKQKLYEVEQLHDPREHVTKECYAKLEERYDVLYREHQVVKEKLAQYALEEQLIKAADRVAREGGKPIFLKLVGESDASDDEKVP